MDPIKENFNLAKIKAMSAIDAKNYLIQYFVPLNDGNHAFYDNGKFVIMEQQKIKSTYFNRMSKELNEFYFRDYTDIRRVTYELNKPVFFDNYINLCPSMKAKNNIPFFEHSANAKKGVEILLVFLKEVWADNDLDSYNYLVKWFANMIQGKKNDACLYLKGQQGIGKSTIPEFIQFYVIGHDLYLQTGSEPLKSRFNLALGGKLLVLFEELENFGVNEWASVSSVLKRYITEKTYVLEGKGTNSFQSNNMNNYMLNSNHDTVKDDDGRRYNILDISNKYMGNHAYFGQLRKDCFNDEVGRAFYSYMMEIDTANFIPQQFPLTKSKLNSFAKRLDKVYCFIKDDYVLKKHDMKITPKDLHTQYKAYCCNNSIKAIEKTQMAEKLDQVGIKSRKVGTNYYIYNFNELLEIANKYKWIHETDEFVNDGVNCELDTDYETIIMDKDNEIKQLKEIIEKQKLEIEKLKLSSTDLVASL